MKYFNMIQLKIIYGKDFRKKVTYVDTFHKYFPRKDYN